ncbi:hypothetical protein Adi01nite_51580 [Amorphoplanes digitatis]|nr:hypothetical protein Adi01nite_51580 [Actinoplanes digitatis]
MPAAQTIEVPVVRRGHHSHPRRGACLMELVSTLTGGPWTDRPGRVHPMLATVCRAVNDRLGDAGRAAVLTAVPWLEHTAAPVPRRQADEVLRDGLLELAARHAGDAALAARRPGQRAAAGALRRAVRRVAARPDRDEAMRRFLFEAIDLVRGHAGLPPVPEGRPMSVDGVGWLPVRVEVRCPDDGLSAYLHCTAELDRWPAELRPEPTAPRASRDRRPAGRPA